MWEPQPWISRQSWLTQLLNQTLSTKRGVAHWSGLTGGRLTEHLSGDNLMIALAMFSTVVALFSPVALGEMYKCGHANNSATLRNYRCGTGERIISVDGIPYQELQRRTQEQKQLESKRATLEATAKAYQRSLASSPRPTTYANTSSSDDRRYQKYLSDYTAAPNAAKNAYASEKAQELRNAGIGMSDKNMRAMMNYEAKLMKR